MNKDIKELELYSILFNTVLIFIQLAGVSIAMWALLVSKHSLIETLLLFGVGLFGIALIKIELKEICRSVTVISKLKEEL